MVAAFPETLYPRGIGKASLIFFLVLVSAWNGASRDHRNASSAFYFREVGFFIMCTILHVGFTCYHNAGFLTRKSYVPQVKKLAVVGVSTKGNNNKKTNRNVAQVTRSARSLRHCESVKSRERERKKKKKRQDVFTKDS